MIGILKDWRGKGFAKILLDSAIASLSRLGATKVWLEVDTNNVAGVRAYESIGFTRYKGITWYQNHKNKVTERSRSARLLQPTSPHPKGRGVWGTLFVCFASFAVYLSVGRGGA